MCSSRGVGAGYSTNLFMESGRVRLEHCMAQASLAWGTAWPKRRSLHPPTRTFQLHKACRGTESQKQREAHTELHNPPSKLIQGQEAGLILRKLFHMQARGGVGALRKAPSTEPNIASVDPSGRAWRADVIDAPSDEAAERHLVAALMQVGIREGFLWGGRGKAEKGE
eukprot:350102-Chlamydomonas_euryale.AAC.1